MVQNIRPPQDLYSVTRQFEGTAKPVRDGDSRVEAEFKTPAPELLPTKEQEEKAVALVKEALRGTTSHLEIEIDHDLHKVVIKIFSGESGEIIRQIPSQELLDLAKHLDDPKGLLVRERA